MSYVVPALLTKTIEFIRMSDKNVLGYEVYATFQDNTYASGVRHELIDTITNPDYPSPILTTIELEYNDNATWELPKDAFIDRDHQFNLYLKHPSETDYCILNPLMYNYNRVSKLITIDTVMKDYGLGDKVKLDYYRDIIRKTYPVINDCTLNIKPIFKDNYNLGFHNIIQ